MSTPSIELYIDILSPFNYIAYYLTRHSPAFSSISTHYTPILLGGLLQQTGGTGPLSIRNKAQWIESERLRLASALEVPIRTAQPAGFPFPMLRCQRVLVYLATLGQKILVKAIDALYYGIWVDGRNVNDEGVLREVLGACFEGELVERAIAESSSEGVKEGLKRNTDAAYRMGAFGLPWFVVRDGKGETRQFWGVDRVASVLAFVGREETARGFAKAML